MRRRIVALAVISATLATSLFGIPLAIAAARHFIAQEATELEHTADVAALDVAADVVHSRSPGNLVSPTPSTRLALYSSDGRLISGHGPTSADPIVAKALADGTIHQQSSWGTLVAVAPIPDQGGGNYAVRATTSTTEVYPQIAVTWLAMLALEAVILTLTWLLARRQAGRLARPVEALAESASHLADGDFTVLAERSGIPEIDTAATALNHAASRIGELVDRERAVTVHASHQLRTPLTGLRLCLENALDTPGADYRKAAREAVAAADRLEQTIDELVMLARDHRPRAETLDISQLFNEDSVAWHRILAESGRQLRIIIDSGIGQPHASTAAVRQILAVLVENAVRHGAGEITIRAREAGDTVAIDVSDEGAGPPADEDLFDRARVEGHGIGLPLARSLAEADGGRLLLTGRQPCTFSLFLATSRGPAHADRQQDEHGDRGDPP